MKPVNFRRGLGVAVSALALFASATAFGKEGDAAPGKGVTWEDIVAGPDRTDAVLMYGFGPKAQRYSKAAQITPANVKNLVPAWSFSFGDERQRGQESQALVYDGVIYVTASYSRVFAIDARTGKKKWSYQHRLADDIRPCCDVVNRGAAIYGDKIYFGTLDGAIVALNRDTGKPVWTKKVLEAKKGYTITGAPTIIKDQKSGRVLLIHGSSGDEFGVVGWLFARDPETGEEVWARPMVEGHKGRLNGQDSTVTGDPSAPSWPNDDKSPTGKVEPWSHGGGAPWQSASFDIETNTIVIGAGNPAPWNGWARWPGDSLFTSGQAYVDANTGELKGFYQHTPNDTWDFSGNNELILFDYKNDKGETVKATAHADRNGFFYVTDRAKLSAASATPNKPTSVIGAWPFVDNITWARGIDLKTGRPIENEGQRPPLPQPGEEHGKPIEVSPPFLGGKNWNPMAYDPDTGLFYIPANNWKEDYWTDKVVYHEGAAYLGMGFRIRRMYQDHVGSLRALDPKTGKIAWSHNEEFPLWGGAMATAGGLIFQGTSDGYLKAFDAKTGDELWKFQTGSGIVSSPVTWEMDGHQYVGIASGYGGAVPLWGGDMADLTKQVSQGGSFWVFTVK